MRARPCPTFRLLAAALLAAGCSRPLPGSAVTLGAIIDTTGTNAEPGWREAVLLAERDMNAALRSSDAFEDLRFDIIVSDSGNDPTLATTRARELVQERGARALILDSSEDAVAVNRMQYDFDASNDLNVPLQCSGCTASRINNPTATDGDAIRQEALRNGKQWLFAGIMSSAQVSLVVVREFVKDRSGSCRDGDCNADSVFKVVTYGANDLEGKDTAAAFLKYANLFHPSPPPLLEQLFHARDADTSSYDWKEDLQKLVNADDDTHAGAIALPDLISISTYAQYYVPIVRLFPASTSKIRFVQTEGFRTESVLDSLGSIAEGREGVSHVVLMDDASGQIFRERFLAQTGQEPGYRTAHYYDNAVTLMLAALVAIQTSGDAAGLTGAQVRQGLLTLGAPDGEVVRTGPDALARAVALLREGARINYEGASGPMDYDAQQTVKNLLSRYRAEGGRYVDLAVYDCVASSSSEDPTACPVRN